jgi:excisionase family DNA binding protein
VDIVTGCVYGAIQSVVQLCYCSVLYLTKKMNPNHLSLLTIPQIAKRWQVSTETVERRIRSGQLPAIKLGHCVRVCPAQLAEYEKNRTFKAA